MNNKCSYKFICVNYCKGCNCYKMLILVYFEIYFICNNKNNKNINNHTFWYQTEMKHIFIIHMYQTIKYKFRDI